MTADNKSPRTDQDWSVDVSGYHVDLPIVAVGPDFAIALMMIIDMGVKFGEHVGRKLAAKLAPTRPDIVVGAATLGIPIAMEVTRALDLDQYVILQKSPKIHLVDAMRQRVSSITSKGEQQLLLDRAAVPLLQGKRVVVVDDVVASGSSLRGSIELVRSAGGQVVGVGVALTEAREWQEKLAEDCSLIQSLAHIPQFSKNADCRWEPIPGT